MGNITCQYRYFYLYLIKTPNMASSQTSIANNIPGRISDSQVLQLLKKGKVDHRHILFFKEQSNISDDILSNWFNINVKTFRNYKKQENNLNDNLKEHLILLVSLYKQGKEVFGSVELFSDWLKKNNFFFEGEKPISFLKTITGIRFIEDRLTAIEYGDNA